MSLSDRIAFTLYGAGAMMIAIGAVFKQYGLENLGIIDMYDLMVLGFCFLIISLFCFLIIGWRNK